MYCGIKKRWHHALMLLNLMMHWKLLEACRALHCVCVCLWKRERGGSNPAVSDGVGSFCVCVCVGGLHLCVFLPVCSIPYHDWVQYSQMHVLICVRLPQMPLSNPLQSTIIPFPGLLHSLANKSACVYVCGYVPVSVFFFNMSASHMLLTPPFLSSPSFLFCSTFLPSLV